VRTLVLGGVRSGKSRWAEAALGESLVTDQPVQYLATGRVADSDPAWRQRVDGHRDRRPPHWSTVETADVAEQLRRSPNMPTLVDDIGGWLTAALDRRQAWEGGCISGDIDELTTVVAATASARRFTDELGALNQRLGALCERVVLVVAGHPLPIKQPGT
jgi:adenosylcobinamide kinase/adenosylcobinamide-phosphate guanylyltransferase